MTKSRWRSSLNRLRFSLLPVGVLSECLATRAAGPADVPFGGGAVPTVRPTSDAGAALPLRIHQLRCVRPKTQRDFNGFVTTRIMESRSRLHCVEEHSTGLAIYSDTSARTGGLDEWTFLGSEKRKRARKRKNFQTHTI